MSKKLLHRIFLIASAVIILHGTMLAVFHDGRFIPETFRYFTIQSNLLIVVVFPVMAVLPPESESRSYLNIAVFVSILITALVYNFVLTPMGGMPLVFTDYSNFATHFLSAVLVALNYFLFEKKGNFSYKHIFAGILPALLYWIVFVSIGGFIGFYPYFFMNPTEIGWAWTFIWFGIIVLFTGALTFGLIIFDKKRGKRNE